MKQLGIPSKGSTSSNNKSANNPRPTTASASKHMNKPKPVNPPKQRPAQASGYPHASNSNPASKPKQPPKPKSNRPLENMTTVDENLRLKATLERGDGRYTKGIFNKKEMVNFNLKISIENLEGLKITSVTAFIKGKNAFHTEKLKPTLFNVAEFDLPTATFGGHIEASVVVDYKIGWIKKKSIKVTVSKNF